MVEDIFIECFAAFWVVERVYAGKVVNVRNERRVFHGLFIVYFRRRHAVSRCGSGNDLNEQS